MTPRAPMRATRPDASTAPGPVARVASGMLVLGALLAFFACAQGGPEAEPEGYRRTAAVDGANELMGAGRCELCHGHQPAPRHHADCESCHGSGQRHLHDVLDPTGIRFPTNAECLDCHETGHRDLLGWSTSEHERAGLLCADCHDPHNFEPRHLRVADRVTRNILPDARPETRICVTCHTDVATKLNLPSHHPVREGMLACSDCHQPHGSERIRLGTETDRCTQCHQAQGGPFIYEHTPVVEDCGHCHVPHGAAADDLLLANQPGACVFCHSVAEAGAVHDPQAFTTRCTDCHGAIHGSFADPQLRR